MTGAMEATRPARADARLPARRRDDLGRREGTDALIRGLGWFSLALGAAEVVAPEAVGKLVGLRTVRDPAVIRMLGLREMAAGLGILNSSRPTPCLAASPHIRERLPQVSGNRPPARRCAIRSSSTRSWSTAWMLLGGGS
jgi:hypothetical protein